MYAYRVLDELTFVKMQWVNEGYTIEDLYSVHMLTDQPKGQSFPKI